MKGQRILSAMTLIIIWVEQRINNGLDVGDLVRFIEIIDGVLSDWSSFDALIGVISKCKGGLSS